MPTSDSKAISGEANPERPAVRLRSWLPIAIVASLFGGVCGFFFKLALLRGVDLFQLNFTTSLILALTAFAALFLTGRRLRAFSIGGIALLSGLLGGIGQLGYFAAMSVGPVSIVAVLINLCPAVTIILSMIFLKERMSRTQFAGVSLAILAGILLVG